jgi:hypothetical protein
MDDGHGQVTVLGLLDFSPLDEAQRLVDSYLNGRPQFVRYGERESSVGRVTCGVPQGSVIGPLLFVFYQGLKTTFFSYEYRIFSI